MHVIPLSTPLLESGDNFAAILLQYGTILPGDILAISSKAVATVEGRFIDYAAIQPGAEAMKWAKTSGQSPEFCQAILEETQRLNGRILPGCPKAMLTELKPAGFPGGVLLAANAGLDESNAPEGTCIGWPIDPVESVKRLHTQVNKQTHKQFFDPSSTSTIAVMITDSTCRPRRQGVTALALVVSGFDPLRSLVGTKDLFGKKLRMTQEAVADQLATAANMLMGNSDASIPAVIIRGHGISFTTFEGWVPGIEPQDDLFQAAI